MRRQQHRQLHGARRVHPLARRELDALSGLQIVKRDRDGLRGVRREDDLEHLLEHQGSSRSLSR